MSIARVARVARMLGVDEALLEDIACSATRRMAGARQRDGRSLRAAMMARATLERQVEMSPSVRDGREFVADFNLSRCRASCRWRLLFCVTSD